MISLLKFNILSVTCALCIVVAHPQLIPLRYWVLCPQLRCRQCRMSISSFLTSSLQWWNRFEINPARILITLLCRSTSFNSSIRICPRYFNCGATITFISCQIGRIFVVSSLILLISFRNLI